MADRAPIPAVGYIRVSTGKQVESGLGLDAQQQAIVTFAVAAGYDLVDVLSDEGISGSLDEDRRPGLLEALETIRDGRAKTVIVAKRDRLARNLSLGGHVETEIRRAGGVLVVVDEAGQSEIVMAVMRMVAEVERLLAVQRTRAAMRQLKARGIAVGRVPFGSVRGEDGRLHPLPEEAEVVDRVRRLRDEGRTLREIANLLSEAGVQTRRGGRWSAEHVRLILKRSEATPVRPAPEG